MAKGVCVWDTTRYGDTINEREVCILLECILVNHDFGRMCNDINYRSECAKKIRNGSTRFICFQKYLALYRLNSPTRHRTIEYPLFFIQNNAEMKIENRKYNGKCKKQDLKFVIQMYDSLRLQSPEYFESSLVLNLQIHL